MLLPQDLPVAVIACKVLQDLLERHLPEAWAAEVTFMDYGLHEVPDRLRVALQDALDNLTRSSLVVLGYGLCGNGLTGLSSGLHTLLIPRSDDCIGLLLGSYEAYRREFEKVSGTYYLSKGWLESGSHPLNEHEEYADRYGPERAMWLMDQMYQHYERLLLVAHDQADLETYRPQALEVARFCERWGMRYEERLGSDRYLRRLIQVARGLDEIDGDFVRIPPGESIRQEQFMRWVPETDARIPGRTTMPWTTGPCPSSRQTKRRG